MNSSQTILSICMLFEIKQPDMTSHCTVNFNNPGNWKACNYSHRKWLSLITYCKLILDWGGGVCFQKIHFSSFKKYWNLYQTSLNGQWILIKKYICKEQQIWFDSKDLNDEFFKIKVFENLRKIKFKFNTCMNIHVFE